MCDNCDWDAVLEDIEGMEESGEYLWAEDTLEGIAIWIEDNHHVTPKQVRAVENIRTAGERR